MAPLPELPGAGIGANTGSQPEAGTGANSRTGSSPVVGPSSGKRKAVSPYMSQLRGVHLEATCHEDEGLPFKCLQCSNTYISKRALDFHIQGVHEGSVANLAKNQERSVRQRSPQRSERSEYSK